MDQQNMDFDNIPQRRRGLKWMWWLFVVVGLFIVCLLIWMFMAINEDDAKYHPENELAPTEQVVPTT